MSTKTNKLQTQKFGTLDYSKLSPGSLVGFEKSGSKTYTPWRQGYEKNAFDNAGGKAAFTTFRHGQDSYTFIPEEYINKGFTANGRQWLPTELFKDNNLKDFLSQSEYVDLSNLGSNSFFDTNQKLGNDVAPFLEQYGMGAKGYLLPDTAKTSSGEEFYYTLRPEGYFDPETAGNIKGLTKTKDGSYVYATDKPNGLIDPIKNESSWYEPPKKNNFAGIAGIALSVFAPGIGTAIGAALGASGIAASVIGNAILQGTLAEASGGDFADGAIRGAISAGVAPAVASTIGSTVSEAMADSAFRNVVTSAVNSSATSALSAGMTGGDIGQAALTGALVGAGSAAGQELGISAEYGTDAFSEQTKALLAQERGLGGASQLGSTLGSAAGRIAAGGDAEQILTSTLLNTVTQGITGALKSTVDDVLKKPAAIVADSGQQDLGVEVPGSDGLMDLINGPSTQLASTDDDAAMRAIEGLRTSTSALDVLGQPMYPDEAKPSEELLKIKDILNTPDGSQIYVDQYGQLADISNPVDRGNMPVDETAPELQEGTEFQGPMGPMTEDKIKRYNDEFSKYLDYIQAGEPPPPDYGVQDLGITTENWESFNQNLKNMMDEGRLPSQWKADEEGNYTYVDDDGSTLTIGPTGDIVHHTESPEGYLPGETPAQEPAKQPATQPTSQPANTGLNIDWGQLLKNAAGMGAVVAGGKAIGDLLTDDNQQVQNQPPGPRTKLKMDWNQADIQAPVNGIAYGQQYFNPVFTEVTAAEGGLMSLAGGGMLGSYSDGGRLLRGPGDGMSDNIPASIAGKRPARLADGEFVIPADVVSHLGNGSTEAGSRVLYKMMERIRKARTGNPKQGKQINPSKFMPK